MSQQVFLHSEINLPPVPSDLLTAAGLPEVIIETADIGYGVVHTKNGAMIPPASYKKSLYKYPPLIEWFKSNRIPGAGTGNPIACQTQTGGTHVIHTDKKRVYALNYIIDTGGDNVITSWYQEKNMPLRRSKDKLGQQTDTGLVMYDNVELLDWVKLEQGKWYLLAVDILHDVGIVEGTRKTITFDFNDLKAISLFEKLNLIKKK